MTRSFALVSLGVVALGVALRRTAPSAAESAPAPVEAPRAKRVWAECRLVSRPGAEVVLAPEIGGLVASMPVAENARVKKGDLVLELARDDHEAALAEARARCKEAEADIDHLAVELERSRKLLAADLLSPQALERTRHDLELARARKNTALAAAAHSEVLIAKTRLKAPIDGVLVRRYVQPGETVLAGARVAQIIDLDAVRVEAEIDEFDAVGIEIGARATVSAEGWPGRWEGRVEELPPLIVARSLEREGPGEPQGSRVLLAKIGLAGRTPLRLGQRVEVNIELGADEPAPAKAVEVVAPPPVAEDQDAPGLNALVAPPAVVQAAGSELAGTASMALTVLGAGFTAFALFASRRRARSLGERRIVRLGADGVMADQDVILAQHETAAGAARVALETGGALSFRAVADDGVEATAEDVTLTIEGVPIAGPTVLVHGMVVSLETGDEPLRFVYLDRAASQSEQDRIWLAEDASFRTAEGDSIADVWSEDEIYVFDDSQVTERRDEDADEESDA